MRDRTKLRRLRGRRQGGASLQSRPGDYDDADDDIDDDDEEEEGNDAQDEEDAEGDEDDIARGPL